jgi:hypothetical protein
MKCDGGKAKHQPEREDRLAGSERAFSSRPVSTLQVRRLKHGPGLPKAFLKWDNAFIDCGLGTIEIPSIIAHITMRASPGPGCVENDNHVDRRSRVRQLGLIYRHHVVMLAWSMRACLCPSPRLTKLFHRTLSAELSLGTGGRVAHTKSSTAHFFARHCSDFFIYSIPPSWLQASRRQVHSPYSLNRFIGIVSALGILLAHLFAPLYP